MSERLGLAVSVQHDAWRSGDQRYYVTDSRKFSTATGWSPAISCGEGVARLRDWLGAAAPPAAAPELTSRAALS
jgi:CDP-paratose 2-epimerase